MKQLHKFDHNGFVSSLKSRLKMKFGVHACRVSRMTLHHNGLILRKIICNIIAVSELKPNTEQIVEIVRFTGVLYQIEVGCLITFGDPKRSRLKINTKGETTH